MASKLTKDQKREKKKREERKLRLRREHEDNRHFKKVDDLMMAITQALQGIGTQEELDAAVLRLGGGKSVSTSDRESRFQSPEWVRLRKYTTSMVSLLQANPSAHYAGFGLDGRIFLNGDGDTQFRSAHFPLNAIMASNWQPDEVVANTSEELEPEPTQGTYFFGIDVRDLAVHFAIASTTSPDDLPEVFFVSPKGWHRLDLGIWRDELWPSLARVIIAKDLIRGPDENQYAIDRIMLDAHARQAAKGGSPDGSTPAFDAKARTIIRSLGSGLLLESEFMLSAAEDARARQNEDALAYQWNEGFESRQSEVDALQDRYRALEYENQTLRRLLLQPTPQEKQLPTSQPAPTKPLQERMGALLGV
ncbi:UNVERIFIED_CONTAM: hypothetical protein C7454_1252 [Acidovorax defluvii]